MQQALQSYDSAKKKKVQFSFGFQGEEMGKEQLCDKTCWHWTWLWCFSCMWGIFCRPTCLCVQRVVCVHPAGVLLFDRSQGFWLSHTIPHFPSFPERGYLYPSSGKVNGQTALCVTYKYEQFLLIGEWTLMKQWGQTHSRSVHTATDFNFFLFAENEKTATLWPGLMQLNQQLYRYTHPSHQIYTHLKMICPVIDNIM